MNPVIDAIVKKLVAEYQPEKIILFGSYAYGTPGPDSDIDLLIIKETTDRFLERWTEVQRILTGTHPHIPLEPLVLTPGELNGRLAVQDQFVEEIVERGVLLYAA